MATRRRICRIRVLAKKFFFWEKCDSPRHIRTSNSPFWRIWGEWPLLNYYSNDFSAFLIWSYHQRSSKIVLFFGVVRVELVFKCLDFSNSFSKQPKNSFCPLQSNLIFFILRLLWPDRKSSQKKIEWDRHALKRKCREREREMIKVYYLW
jgi:hypothetical protein